MRLLYHQYVRHLLVPAGNNEPEPVCDSSALSYALHTLNEAVSLSGAKLIIVYHPFISLNKDGTMKIDDETEPVKMFSDLCEENGIYFISMTERFLNEYAKDSTIPYGFMNTSVAKGHLNENGHRMLADEVYRLITRIEAQS